MSEKLARTRAKRAGNRSIITKLLQEAECLIEAEPIDEPRLKVLAATLDERLNLVKSFDEKVIETCKVDEVESEIVEADEFNSRVMEIVRKIIKTTTPIVSTMAGTTSDKNANPGSVQSTGSSIGGQPANVDSENAQVPGSAIPTGIQSSDVLSNNQVENTQQSNFNSHAGIATPQVPPGPGSSGTNFQFSNNSNFSGNANSNHVNPMAHQTKAKLPKLVLPKFRGDVTQWQNFWDSFNTSIHNNTQLSQIDNFNHLHSLLESQAARSIQGLPRTEANYNAAIEILHKRFGKPQNIISKHMDEMLKITGCVNDNAPQLRAVYDKISINIHGLESLGVNSNQYGSLLIPVIMSKMPPEIRVQIARNTSREVWEMSELLEVI